MLATEVVRLDRLVLRVVSLGVVDCNGPIRDKYSGHVISLDQSGVRIQVT